jgi:hypothetical protein
VGKANSAPGNPNRVTFPDKKVIKRWQMDVPEDVRLRTPRKQTAGVAWRSLSTWMPLVAFAMLLAGVWQLIPPRSEEPHSGPSQTGRFRPS